MVLTNISFQLQSKFLYASAADEGSCYYFSHFIKLYKIQRVISCSTRLIFKAPKFDLYVILTGPHVGAYVNTVIHPK